MGQGSGNFRFKFTAKDRVFEILRGALETLHGAEFRSNLTAFANIKAKFIVIKPIEILIFRACVTLENRGVAVFLRM